MDVLVKYHVLVELREHVSYDLHRIARLNEPTLSIYYHSRMTPRTTTDMIQSLCDSYIGFTIRKTTDGRKEWPEITPSGDMWGRALHLTSLPPLYHTGNLETYLIYCE